MQCVSTEGQLICDSQAQVVLAMKSYTMQTCLAIGDGNNDTPMIKAASIGVVSVLRLVTMRVFVVQAVHGVEGTAAVAAADYVIPSVHSVFPLLVPSLLFSSAFFNGCCLFTDDSFIAAWRPSVTAKLDLTNCTTLQSVTSTTSQPSLFGAYSFSDST